MTSEPQSGGAQPNRSRAVVGTAATNVLIAVWSLVSGIVVARLLGPEARGHLAAAAVIGGIVGALGALSLGESAVYFIGQKRARPRVVLLTATSVAVVSTTIAVVLAYFVIPTVLSGRPEAVTAARLYCLMGFVRVFLGFAVSFFRALERYPAWNLLRLASPACWLVSVLAFAVMGNRNVAELVATFFGAQLLFVPLAWTLVRRASEGPSAVDRSLYRPLLMYGVPLLLAGLPKTLNVRLDQLFLANAASATDLGRYAVAVSFAGLGRPLVSAIGGVLFPRLASMPREHAIVAFSKATRGAAIVAILTGVAAALAAPVAIPVLFGRGFEVPFTVSFLLAAATSVLALNLVVEEGLRGLGMPRTLFRAEASGLVVTVIALLALIPPFGITGAALASLLGYAGVMASLLRSIHVRLAIAPTRVVVPRRADVRSLVARAQRSRTSNVS